MENQLVSSQALLFFECIKIGILMGVIYDLLRVTRKIVKHLDLLVHIEDLLYWVGCSILGFSILYMHNYAEIRIFAFLGMILGATLYFLSFSLIFMKIVTQIIEWIRYVLSIVFNILKIPVNWTIQALAIPIGVASDVSEKAQDKTNQEVRKLKRNVTLSGADFKTNIYATKNRKDIND
ncbi:hypothetical protein AN639_08675 [Candidatus Epulonipiscium fishelsonii]|uniref:Uncharacterized protein n=1 Tax=Candidatus Epulonipiscium fishelsonii TaxID=77094 RepID=A0ACC8X9P6_9FIRM|nr:hypothetical protein AN639_08675 [Epulopiscium sp. SCG-B05WGA-EpuloA1]ONI38811.1 hypothetical protein AN396_10015 [Epulopiscium sp. SCG-B11WGA-EpuloA1]ONI47455.1 hypothetical protein AN644_05265 [Epulopiscium sp. SCG-C06WGA-EpuloA1]